MSAVSPSTAPAWSRWWNASGVTRLRREGAVAPVLAFVVFFVVYVIINPALLTRFQLQTAANLVVPLVLVALAQLVIVLVGGIDISIGAIMSLANVVFAVQLETMPVPVAILLSLGVGLGCGLFNGFLVAYGGLPAIAVTLASAFIFGSLAREVLDAPGGGVTKEIYLATSGELLPYLPVSLVWLAVIAVLLWLLLQRTSLGRHIYGVGSNMESVRAAGLNAKLTKLLAFGLAGVLTSLGAMMLASSTVTGDPRSGDPYLLSSIAAVALAGAVFTGGRGSIIGTILAACTLGLIGNLLFFARVNSYWQYVISALIIVAVVGIPVVWRKVAFRVKGNRS
ncbi:ABC transporter permease [Herbiconiux sp. KACC 21604]|uniref:ABC transporter permease n=1 Tax=unclassified Herbiconiux TaxID=2618217 RepID=UPI001492C91D|nr:ABC transporter permease [Herbiconiux sp. SALV-R1]QJU55075.1 ABC transporter permease [Herbiconiux sp. SALV-R1]WPO86218.1 ABC transporter permease [Herbiconiux sp. KACC 21604]